MVIKSVTLLCPELKPAGPSGVPLQVPANGLVFTVVPLREGWTPLISNRKEEFHSGSTFIVLDFIAIFYSNKENSIWSKYMFRQTFKKPIFNKFNTYRL